MKKILHYYPSSVANGGPKVYIETIVNSALKEKFEFDRAGYNRKDDGSFLKVYRLLRDRIKETKPDIVHIHGCQSEGFLGVMAARAARCRNIVLTVHGFAFDDTHTSKRKKIVYRRIVEPMTLRKASCVYCVCGFAERRDIIRKNTKKNLIGHIYNPYPPFNITSDRKTVREKLGFSDEDVVAVIASRVSVDKGYDILADVIKRSRGRPELKFLILGTGDYESVLRRELAEDIEKRKVILYGSTNTVYDFLNASDLYIFPSYHENCSIALIEAGRAGLAAIASDVGGNGEIVCDGESGFLIREQNAGLYYDALVKLASSPELRSRMGEAARALITERFSPEKVMKEIENVYEKNCK